MTIVLGTALVIQFTPLFLVNVVGKCENQTNAWCQERAVVQVGMEFKIYLAAEEGVVPSHHDSRFGKPVLTKARCKLPGDSVLWHTTIFRSGMSGRMQHESSVEPA